MKTRLFAILTMLSFLLLSISGGAAAQNGAARGAVSRTDAASAVYLPLVSKSFTPTRVGLVSDENGLDDKSFNDLAWKGVSEAKTRLGVSGNYLESTSASDYATNIQQFLNADEDLIVTVGFLMGVDTATAAKANPLDKFAIADYSYPDCWVGAMEGVDCGSFSPLPNVRGLTFQVDEASLLAGYLAAGMTTTGKVGVYGGMQLPSVTIFMKGFQAGVMFYNQLNGTQVELLGWNEATQSGLFTDDFNSFSDGVNMATYLVSESADIIFPVAGPTGFGSASYCQSSGNCLVIGVDTDWFITAPQYASVELSSVMKNVDVAVYKTIQDMVEGKFSGGTHIYDLADGGVGLAPFHNFDSLVPQDLKADLGMVEAGLISGMITVDGILGKKVGLVTEGSVDDKSFNSLAWKGVTDAVEDFYVNGGYLESSGASDYVPNIQQLLEAGDDLIVTVGFPMGVVTAGAAKANPTEKFAIVDYSYPDCWPGAVEGVDCGSVSPLPNVRGLVFQADEASFLAGYLAAGMTTTGIVGVYGGMQLPTVTIFMKGYEAGIKYYNDEHSASIQLLGWNNASQTGLFTNNFNSFTDGVNMATNLVSQGADIIFPVAGPTGFGSASHCQTSGNCLVIGVDTDWFITAPQYASVELSSVLKNVDVAVYKTIEDLVNGAFSSGTRIYDLGDDGVDLAPFHDFDSLVPQALKDEIAQAKADLINGVITVDGVLGS